MFYIFLKPPKNNNIATHNNNKKKSTNPNIFMNHYTTTSRIPPSKGVRSSMKEIDESQIHQLHYLSNATSMGVRSSRKEIDENQMNQLIKQHYIFCATSMGVRSSRKSIDKNQMNQLVEQQGYTKGLAHSINELKNNFPLRIWIVDNSGSMQNDDGHRFVVRSNSNNTSMKNTAVKDTTTSIKNTSVKNTRDIQIVSCSRWNVSCWVRKKKYSDMIHHSYYDIIPSFIQSP
jgi:hypothetical protein